MLHLLVEYQRVKDYVLINVLIDNTEDLDVVGCLYHLIEHNKNYKKESNSLWNLSDCNGTRTHNHLVCKQTLTI